MLLRRPRPSGRGRATGAVHASPRCSRTRTANPSANRGRLRRQQPATSFCALSRGRRLRGGPESAIGRRFRCPSARASRYACTAPVALPLPDVVAGGAGIALHQLELGLAAVLAAALIRPWLLSPLCRCGERFSPVHWASRSPWLSRRMFRTLSRSRAAVRIAEYHKKTTSNEGTTFIVGFFAPLLLCRCCFSCCCCPS